VNGLNFNFIFAIEDLVTRSVFFGQSLIHFDNSSKKAELNGYSFLSYSNNQVSELKINEIKTSIEIYFKGEFKFERSYEFENILGYNYYVAYIRNAIDQRKYYVFSQQVDKQMEYELEGVFASNNASNASTCCCMDESNKWQVYPFVAEDSIFPDFKLCTVSLNKEICKK